jgi:deazaflavin-dependent oxidoreductase (nitroreductase family)
VAEIDSYNRQGVAAIRAGRGELQGLPLLLLHHVGAKSGLERVTPLVYWRLTDKSLVVLASNFGALRHPDWFYNLVANPRRRWRSVQRCGRPAPGWRLPTSASSSSTAR